MRRVREPQRGSVTMSALFILPLGRGSRMGLRLRDETEEDCAFTRELYASSRMEELRAVPWTTAEKSAFLQSQHDAQRLHYRQNYPDAHWWIIELSGRPVGRLYLARWSTEIRIIDIAFIPEARGRGFGTCLLLDILDMAGEIDRPVTIHVEAFNRARSLYHRIGFRIIEDKGVYLLLRWSPSPAAACRLEEEVP
jgi:ribosomal protein S18 acetylase RimI-like enzyme